MIVIKEILQYLDSEGFEYKFFGDENDSITGFSSLSQYKSGNMTWVKKQANYDNSTNEGRLKLAVIQTGVKVDAENILETEISKRVFFEILEQFFGESKNLPAIGQGTYIAPEVKIGKNVIIGHNCTLDGEITIGDGTRIYNNVSIINRCQIGENCVIQSGVNIGHDGFGYSEDEKHVKTMVKHFGGVVIGEDVLIGANTCIARGTINDTIIGEGSKIDTLCHIAHNVALGKNVSLITGSLIYGSVIIGNNAYVASGIIKNQHQIGTDAFVGMGSVVINDVPEGTTVYGVPAREKK